MKSPSLYDHALTDSALHWRPDVFVITDDHGDVRIADLACGKFYALDRISGQLLTWAEEAGVENAILRLSKTHSIEEEDARQVWPVLRDELCKVRLLQNAIRTAGECEPRRSRIASGVTPSKWTIWLWLVFCWVHLRFFGWSSTVRFFSEMHPPRCTRSLTSDQLLQVDEVVRLTASTMFLNPQCKERAIVAWHALRSRFAAGAELKIGVLFYPFAAHAWVECDGLVVSDFAERCADFRVIESYC